MEKQRIFTRKKSFGRLLNNISVRLFILLSLILPCTLYAETQASREVSIPFLDTVFTAEKNQQFYTSSEILFTTKIPDLMPGEIEISVPKDEHGIHFRTMRSSQYYENDGSGGWGAKIELCFTFAKAGKFTIPPLEVKIRRENAQIKFAPVTIALNPMDLQPRLVIDFSNGQKKIYSDQDYKGAIFSAKKGQAISFSIGIQYVNQLNQFDWESPENAILSHKKTYDTSELISQNQKSTNSAAKNSIFPIGEYELTILKAGRASFPRFTATVTAYNGSKFTIDLADFWIDVQESSLSSSGKKTDKNDYYSESFKESFESQSLENELSTDGTNSPLEITTQDCKTLAELRSKERKNPFSKARKERRELEVQLGIASTNSATQSTSGSTNNLSANTNAPDEFPAYLIPVSIFFAFIFCGILIIFIRRKNFSLAIIFGILVICSAGAAIYTSSASKIEHGISTECTLASIPEPTAEAQTNLPAGSYVQILEKSGDWCYVRFGATVGWCQNENIFFIK
ncbi:MAG: hypothetical protein K6A43_04275 [Treponema sp.]|nr:hypothetical protein [Treponema sp.]